jgi:hypothetical protein
MGPFTKLPEDTGKRHGVRSLVLDTVYTLAQVSALRLASGQSNARLSDESTIGETFRQGLCSSVTSATRGTSEESYWSALCVMPE